MNKNISVWRGSEAPPTTNHIWIKDNNIHIYNGNDWEMSKSAGVKWSILEPLGFGDVAYSVDNKINLIKLSQWDNSLGEPVGIILTQLEDGKYLVMSTNTELGSGPIYNDTQQSLQDSNGLYNSWYLKSYSYENNWVTQGNVNKDWYLPSKIELQYLNVSAVNSILQQLNKPIITTSVWSSTITTHPGSTYFIELLSGMISGFSASTKQYHRILFTRV